MKKLALLLSLKAATVSAQADIQSPLGFQSNNATSSCHDACTSLVSTLGEKVYYQTLPDELFTAYFTAQQSDIRPRCLVLPTSAEDVSDAIKVIAQHECIFAVKSGGHAMFAGASNAPDGITLDLRYLNGLGISDDRETAFIGTGNRWGDVYGFLNQWNLTVTGGRDSQVGVGGFLLGGGISYISRKYGWGLDNVRNYELVLANGSIVRISYSTHPDLYWALRGGGGNFGIVTRFDMETHPLEPMHGGYYFTPLANTNKHLSALGMPRAFSWTINSALETSFGFLVQLACRLGYCTTIDAMTNIVEDLSLNGASDSYAQAYIVLVKVPYVNQYIYVVQMTHGGGLADSAAFRNLNALNYIWNTGRAANSAYFAEETKALNALGQRVTYRTATFRFNAVLVKEIMKIYLSELDPIRRSKGILGGGMPIMLINKDELSHMSKNGGNSLGIEEDDGPLLLITATFQWGSKEDDEAVYRAAKNIIDRSVLLAKDMGLHHPYIYQNYAADGQDVFGGLPAENRERLRSIQRKYDPDGVFSSRLNPGYFKV